MGKWLVTATRDMRRMKEESPFRPYQDPSSLAGSPSGDRDEREFCAKPHHVGDGEWDNRSSL